MKRSFLQIQTTSDWAQIWCGGWNCVLIEAYQISAKLETKNFWGFGLVCFGHKSGLAHPPFLSSFLVIIQRMIIMTTEKLVSAARAKCDNYEAS